MFKSASVCVPKYFVRKELKSLRLKPTKVACSEELMLGVLVKGHS
jgi:hypothetical protein